MTRQERASRTRTALIKSAAARFADGGYAGTGLKSITAAAGMSTGALTFHFASKSELADAVVEEARAVLRPVVGEVLRSPGAARDTARDLVTALVRLLHDDVLVRAAARLELERPEGMRSWSAGWYPELLRLAERAWGETRGRLAADGPDQLAALAALFVRSAVPHFWHRADAQASAADRGEPAGTPGTAALDEHLRLWAVAWRALLASDDRVPHQGPGTPVGGTSPGDGTPSGG
ncbi:TetR family transcriptional regulator [Streptomyces parvus]|uniref:TetR family transcriptional regulator n=1 Tax=Streptomyces parvus TaxID=66428 RepID=UPI00331A2F36|nr:TetR family transcriptional regulator [Streptomyces globisporus]